MDVVVLAAASAHSVVINLITFNLKGLLIIVATTMIVHSFHNFISTSIFKTPLGDAA